MDMHQLCGKHRGYTLMGRREWERIHGRSTGPIHPGFKGYGWKWMPLVCRCQGAHYLDQDDRTKRGLT